MKTDLAMEGLAVPLRALRVLALDFPDLPAPTVHISPIYPERLQLSLHDDLGAFEPWRLALHIARDAVDFHSQGDGETWVLEAYVDVTGATVRLNAFGDARVPERPSVAKAGR
ncbi:hypothetical protein AB0E78_02655 [Streptomyces sp. NPDC032198]|uniref:hypothetical protein n=1 Tax=unclassified Streptomyces TaxID=2593676 RepID=UPI0033D3EBA1|nr:hypothetical protein OG302_29495 [Streptomyces sp. NBC_01283]